MAKAPGRHYENWLEAYLSYAGYSEAPKRMHFWTAVSTIAGALRRKVWIDQIYFKWHPNFYVIFVAPPGVVSKSTTIGIGMKLLRQVPDVKFGPDVITWPALLSAFAESTESFFVGDELYAMSPLTLESSEFGNLFNPKDRDMVDLFVSLWDGKTGSFEKRTKFSGCDSVENPWINLIACTTPSWIAGNFPEYLIGGGFTSRCVFVYAEQKAKLVAYPKLCVPQDIKETEQKLVEDLCHISSCLAGPYELTPKATEWGTAWYENWQTKRSEGLEDSRFGGYIARKQTHLHKLAMILAAASSDDLVITEEHLQIADIMITDLEKSMMKVFSQCGRSDKSDYAERIIHFVERRGEVSYADVYAFIHSVLPSARDFEDVLMGCIRSHRLVAVETPSGLLLRPSAHGDELDQKTADIAERQVAQKPIN